MFRFADISLERKLKLIILLTSSFVLLFACLAIVLFDLITFRRAMTDDLESLAQMIGINSSASLDFNIDPETVEETLRALKAKPAIVAGALYDRDGHPFGLPYLRDDQRSRFEVPKTPPHPSGSRFGPKYLSLVSPVIVNGDRVGTVYLHSDLQELTGRFKRYAAVLFSVIAVSTLGAFLLSSRLQRMISAPILHLAQTARTVSIEKNYSLRARKESKDEMGTLIDGFNEMLAQIQERDAALQGARDQLERRVQERTAELQLEIQERKQAEQALKQQLTRTSLLNHITHAIAERQDLHSVLGEVLKQLADHLPIEFGCVQLFDQHTRTFSLAACRLPPGAPPGWLAFQCDEIERSRLKECLRGELRYVRGLRPEHDRVSAELAALGVRSVVAVPLIVDSRLFGLLLVGRREQDTFTSGECEFLKMLCEQVGLAAHQAQLHTQVQGAYEELRQTQQAVMQHERLRALGEMASGIAHDVNNSLSPIVGFADFLLQDEPGLSETARRHLQHIRTAGEDIAHIVARLREFYRSRDAEDETSPVRLNDLCAQVIELTRPRWRDISQERGVVVKVVTDFDPRLPEVRGNESELREALMNLVFNSVDAMPSGGQITVRTGTGAWEGARQDQKKVSHVLVEIRDTGIGMDDETAKRCLEPFFSTKGRRGTGLGLAMVYGVVERHNGRIEIDSAPGKGTCTRLILPVLTFAPNRHAPSPASGMRLPSYHILFVDDEPLLRELMKEVLEKEGHRVELADGGQTGLEAFHTARRDGRPFDLVITDLGMPYLDGRRLAQILKQEAPGLPIIMLTGWGAFMKADGELPTHVDVVLSKPPKLNDLKDAIWKLMQVRLRTALTEVITGEG